MIYGLYTSAAGMLVGEYRQAVLANNLANADTVGFKRDVAVFAERRPAWAGSAVRGPAELLKEMSGGVWLAGSFTDHSFGSLQKTGAPLDVALDGPGFFVVEKNGREYLTRDGRLTTDARGRLIAASDGATVVGSGGQPILVNPVGAAPRIDEVGRVIQDGAIVGELAIVDVGDYRTLRKAGAGRFVSDEARPIPAGALVLAGHVEQSGVEPVRELVSMIEAARAYQLNAQMVGLQDQTLGRLAGVIASA